MKGKFVLGLLLAISQIYSAHAQCSFSVTTAVTESRCRASGSITVTPSTSGSFVYQITAGPITVGTTTTNVFEGLPAGTYTVVTNLGGCNVSSQVTVPGTYVEPGLQTGVIKKVACPNGTGCITANQPTGGRPPYTYALVAPSPVTRPPQSSPVFCGIPAGIYTLQSYDSCGVVRTTDITLPLDTGNFVAYTYGYDLRFSSCNDLIVCPTTGFSNTSSHSLLKIWYVKPNGDTIKQNVLESPVRCDTLVGEAHSFGNWQMVAFDSCGRVRVSTFSFTKPTTVGVNPVGNICGGYQINLGNPWKYNLKVTYNVRRCSDNSIVYTTTQLPQTTYFSPTYDLKWDTCYKFEAFNECGDTLRYQPYTRSKPVFGINACVNPACSVLGKGDIQLSENYLTGIKPITFTIISGPEGIGNSVVQPAGASYVFLRNLALGTYTIEGVDACGQKTTITVNVNKPLQRKIDITYTLNCSGGQDVHVKVTSNYKTCGSSAWGYYGNQYNTIVTSTSPGISPVNISQSYISPTQPNSVWEADYVNVRNTNSLLLRLSAYDGCTFDTTIAITPYVVPVVTNQYGFICPSTGIGVVNFTLTGGKPAYQYRVRPSGTTTWGPWQSTPTFSGIGVGTYDFNAVDACPNGSITTVSFVPWIASAISVSPQCVNIGSSATFSVSTPVIGVLYEWLFNGNVVGTGLSFTIANFGSADNGTYTLRQTFPGGGCVESTTINYSSCGTLPIEGLHLVASIQSSKALLTWETLTESNTARFEIQKSKDASYFTSIGSTAAAGNSNGLRKYGYIDPNPGTGKVFYRIKAIDKDDKYSYSNVAVVQLNPDKQVSIFPNPSTDIIKVSASSNFLLNMYNSEGQLIESRKILPGLNEIDARKYAKGIYMIIIKDQISGQLITSEKLVLK